MNRSLWCLFSIALARAAMMLSRWVEWLALGRTMRRAGSFARPDAWILALLALSIVALSSAAAFAEASAENRTLRVAVFDAPPFSMKNQHGEWEGLSVGLWAAVAEHQGWKYELREYETLARLLKDVQTGEVDVTPAVASSLAYEVAMDLSHSYYPSGSGIAVPVSGSGFRWLGIVEQLASIEFLRLIALLLLIWLSAGTAVWLFERRRNRAMFGEGLVAGVGNGMWWAAVTMTTVGYGDKAPRTLGGRAVAIVFMLASIVMISGVTAGITTALTLDGLSGTVHGVEDLPGLRVGATSNSESLRSLGERGIVALPFDNERDGLRAMVDGEIDAFAFNVLVLRYVARTEFLGVVRVLPSTFDPYQVKMAMSAGSPVREPLNRALLAIIESDEWTRQVETYLGSEP